MANRPQSIMAEVLKSTTPDLVLHTGDVIYPSGEAVNYNPKFFIPYKDTLKRVALYPTIGNHDSYTPPNAQPYLDAFVLPENSGTERYYSFDYADAHFVCLDIHDSLGSGSMTASYVIAQRDWLIADLASSTKTWKFVFFHKPPYSSNADLYHGSDDYIQAVFCPVFDALGVDMVFSGHSHHYERTKPITNGTIDATGITYVVTGGGGGGIANPCEPPGSGGNCLESGNWWTDVMESTHHLITVNIRREQCLDVLELQAINFQGSQIDSLTINKTRSCCVTPPLDMVAWWPLDETQGSTAFDIAGSFNNDGTWTNSPVPVTGTVSGALSFNGSNYVQVSPQTELDFGTGDFSIDVWVQTNDSTSTRTLVDKRTGTSPSLTGYHLYLYNGKPGLQLADGSYTNYNSTASTAFVADGTWHHIAVTVDRNNTSGLNIYVDGASVASLDPTGHVGNLNNNAPLVFGGKNQITPSYTFVGTLDELELFNRALTQTEIQDIYNAGSAGKCKPTPTPAPMDTGTVLGWVEDVDEEPLEGVTVAIKEEGVKSGQRGIGEFSASTETDEDGYYEFGGLPKGNYTITYKKEGYRTQTQDVSLNEGEEKDLDITTLEQIETGEIFGNVEDINGNPLESVSLTLKGKKTKVKQTASSDEDGYFEFTDLEADTYLITATIKGYKSAKQTITLKKGEDREIEFKLKKKREKIIKGSVR